MTVAIDRESPAYRALVHEPPCADAAIHAQRTLAVVGPDLPDLEYVARLIVDSRNDETDTAWRGLGACEECE